MKKLVKCKVCGAEIASNAKVCPQCGAKNKKPIYKKWWFYVLILAVLVGIISSAGTKTQTVTGGTGTTSGTAGTTSGTTQSETLYEVTNVFTNVEYNSVWESYYYDAIVEVENISDSNIKLSNEKFDVVNADGVSVAHDSFMVASTPDIIMPGEKGYIYTMSSLSLTDITEAESQNLELQYSFTASTTSSESYRYPVTDVSVSKETYTDSVTCVGTLENDTDKDDDYVYVNVIFFDADNKPIGAAGTSISDLTAGKKVKFEVGGILYDIPYDKVASYTVIAER